MNQQRFTAVAALVCDDVRNELSGKEILIGVFADNVYVGLLPANLVASLYLRVRFARAATSNIKFRVLAPGGIQVTPEAPIALSAPTDLETIVSIVIRGIVFQAQAEGRYEFQWQPPEQDWETVTSLHIRKGLVSQPGAIPPPSVAGRPRLEQSPASSNPQV
jgi:hypothetical protein